MAYLPLAVLFCLSLGVLAAPNAKKGINTCGCAKAASNRIVGGKEVSPKHKYPFQVWLQGAGSCGGSIINKRYVLTAAHCLFGAGGKLEKAENMYIQAGAQDMCAEGQIIMIEKVIVRSDYNKDLANDVAILKLSEDIKFTDKIKPVCLPEQTKDYTGQTATVSGWGTTVAYNPGQKAPDSPIQCALKETSVKVLPSSDKECNIATGGDSKTRLCVWAKGTGSCQGDSGGPLTVVEGGHYVQIGVVSYAAGCGTTTSEGAGVYARVSNYVDWIKKVTADGNC